MTETNPRDTRRTALITGASAGLGAECARQLAARGYDLVLTARREDRLLAMAEELTRSGNVSVTVVPSDLSTPGAPAALEAALAERGLPVDVLVNNAGSVGPNLLEDRGWEQHEQYLRLMLVSIAEMCHRFVPPMRERGWGRVLNVASVAGRIARPGDGHYGPAKSWVIALSEELNLSLRNEGVHVTALCPGFTHTEFHEVGGVEYLKTSLPGWLWYSAETVVRDGLKALEKNRPICISGRVYRWLDPLMQSVLTRQFIQRSGVAPKR